MGEARVISSEQAPRWRAMHILPRKQPPVCGTVPNTTLLGGQLTFARTQSQYVVDPVSRHAMKMFRKGIRQTVCLALYVFVAGCAQAPRSPVEAGTFRRPAAEAGATQDSGSILSGVLRAAEAVARNDSVWPGFDLRDQVLLAVVQLDGPVYLIGDPAPPSDYRWLDSYKQIAVREGPPPDSLTGLRLNLDWNGRTGAATAVTFAPDQGEHVASFLLHEAFHTYQGQVNSRAPDRFKGFSNPAFPDTSVEALALLNLEGVYLGRALQAEESDTAQVLARTALALRIHRCAALGAKECAQERSIEQREGTATYVHTAMLGEALGYGGPLLWQDSLARALAPVRDLQRLERWHFYNSGHAWMLLLDQFGPAGWKSRVESLSPDEVLADALNVQRPEADSLMRVAQQSRLWSDAQRSAHEVVGQELARRDSLERAFWDRTGVPVRVYFGRVSRLSSGQTQLPDGRLEQTFNFASNQVAIRGPSRSICCPGAMTVAPVTGRVAQVNGVPVRLDQAGAQATGTIVLDLPEIALRLDRGELRVHSDSVTIRVQ